MSIATHTKRPITLVGAIATANLISGIGLLIFAAIGVARSGTFDWSPPGWPSIGLPWIWFPLFQVWMFASIYIRGGLFKDSQVKPAK